MLFISLELPSGDSRPLSDWKRLKKNCGMGSVALPAAAGCSQGRSWRMFVVCHNDVHVQLPAAVAVCFAFWMSLRFLFQKIAPRYETVIKRGFIQLQRQSQCVYAARRAGGDWSHEVERLQLISCFFMRVSASVWTGDRSSRRLWGGLESHG